MNKTAWRILAIASMVLALAALIAAAVMGGCDACLETTGGSCVPMKCHWTLRAVIAIEAVAAFACLGLLFVREAAGRRWLAGVAAIAQAAVLAVLYTPLMGLCADTAMHCRTTAAVCAVLAVGTVIVCAVAFAKADTSKAGLPKRGL